MQFILSQIRKGILWHIQDSLRHLLARLLNLKLRRWEAHSDLTCLLKYTFFENTCILRYFWTNLECLIKVILLCLHRNQRFLYGQLKHLGLHLHLKHVFIPYLRGIQRCLLSTGRFRSYRLLLLLSYQVLFLQAKYLTLEFHYLILEWLDVDSGAVVNLSLIFHQFCPFREVKGRDSLWEMGPRRWHVCYDERFRVAS